MNRHSLLTAAVLVLAAPLAAAQTLQAETRYWLSDDSENSRQHRVFTGMSRAPTNAPDTWIGAGAGYWHFEEAGQQTRFVVAEVSAEHAIDDRTRIIGSGSLLNGREWSPLLGEARLTRRFSGPFYAELSASRDIIDTVGAIANRWDVVSYGGSVDIGPFQGFTVVGGYTRQALGDDNDRNIYVTRLIYEPPATERWLIQLRSRLLRADFNSVGFFAPERLDEHLLLTTYRRPVLQQRWFFSIEAGGGFQQINRGSSREVYSVEAVWRGWFTDHVGLDARAGCMNTGGFDTRPAGGGYRYCQGGASLLWSW